MFASLQSFIRHELDLFHRLSSAARALYFSILSQSIAAPLLGGAFSISYLWRISSSLEAVFVFFLFLYAGIYSGMLLNGVLLRRLSVIRIYASGLLLQGLAMGALYLLPTTTPGLEILAGFGSGMFMGIYWGNRNVLMLTILRGADREYFSALEVLTTQLLSIVAPLAWGWFIALRSVRHEAVDQYPILMAVICVVLLTGTLQVWRARLDVPDLGPRLSPRFFPGLWAIRAFCFVSGFGSFVFYTFPPLCTLRLLGMEGVLGTVQSVAAMLSALVVYLVNGRGRPLTLPLFRASVVLFLLAGVVLAIWFNTAGAVVFVLCCTIALPLMWSTINPMVYGALSAMSPTGQHYALICDREISLTAGRVVAGALLCLLVFLFSTDFVLRFGLIIVAVLQVPSLLLADRVQKMRRDVPAATAVSLFR